MDILKRNNVKVTGEGDKVLLFAHGFGCNQNMWSQVAPAFLEGHRVVLFDYVGSGASLVMDFDHRRYSTLNGYARDVLDVCEALDLTSGVTFVGHSVSCSIGMLASIARPGLFERLIMVGPSPCFVNHMPDYVGGFERTELDGLLALMDQNYIGWANYLTPVISGESNGGPVASELADSFCSTDPIMARIFAEATFYADNRADLQYVDCPSLILQHRHDALAPVEVGEYLHRHLRNSTLQVLDVVGHCSHMSHPQLVIDAMRNYLPA
ncbi:MhpC Predicted hydrolases or acyltransferases (alpha/beta hydrolase superfamily) [Comamonadaceae bacterium]